MYIINIIICKLHSLDTWRALLFATVNTLLFIQFFVLPPHSPCLFTTLVVETLSLALTRPLSTLEDWDWSPPSAFKSSFEYFLQGCLFSPAGPDVCTLAWSVLTLPCLTSWTLNADYFSFVWSSKLLLLLSQFYWCVKTTLPIGF